MSAKQVEEEDAIYQDAGSQHSDVNFLKRLALILGVIERDFISGESRVLLLHNAMYGTKEIYQSDWNNGTRSCPQYWFY